MQNKYVFQSIFFVIVVSTFLIVSAEAISFAKDEVNHKQSPHALTAEIKELLSRIKRLEREKSSRVETIGALHQSMMSAEEEVLDQEKEIIELRQIEKKLKRDLAKSKHEIDKLNGEVVKIKNRINSSGELLPFLVAESTAPLYKRINDLNEKLNKVSDVAVEKENTILKLQNDHKVLQREFDNLLQDNRNMGKMVIEAKDELKNVQKNLPEQVEQARRPLIDEIRFLENQRSYEETSWKVRLQQTKAPYQEEIANLNRQLTETQKKFADNDILFKNLQKEKNRILYLLDESESLKEVLEIETKQFKSQMQRNAARNQEYSDSQIRRQMKVQVLTNDLKKLQVSVDKKIQLAKEPLEFQLRQSRQKLKDREVLLENKGIEISKLNAEKAALKNQLQNIREELKNSKIDIEKLSLGQQFNLDTEKAVIMAQRPLEQRIKSLEIEIDKLQIALSEKERLVNQLQEEFLEIEQNKDLMAAQHIDFEEIREEIERALHLIGEDFQ